ncbi:MRPL41 [Auxenochlorella protothecoides x Auxenochlorella symbiontica]
MTVLGGLASLLGRGRRVTRTGFTQLTSKNGPRNFYKGKGCLPTGQHTKKGGYVQQAWRMPEILVPDLSKFNLKPYVAVSISPVSK